MIREDRLQLNDRFKTVFQMLEDRGTIKKNDRNGKGVGDVAEKVLGNRTYGHIVRAFLDDSNKRVIDYGQARAFCKAYNINEEFMIDGIGTPFDSDNGSEMFLHYVHPENTKGNILFTNVEAFAGTTLELNGFAKEQHTFFSLPGLSGNGLVAFPINGNSMEPVINDGDIVICRELNGLHEVKDNQIYAIRSKGSVWVKYVQRVFNSRGRVTSLKLLSANYLEYDPFVEEVDEYSRLYRVVRRISSI